MTELVREPLATSSAGKGVRLFVRVASIGPPLVGGVSFVLAGLDPFHDAEWMLQVFWVIGALMVALGILGYWYFSPMLANCPVSILLSADQLVLTMPAGNRLRFPRDDPRLSFDLRQGAPGVNPRFASFQMKTLGRAFPQPISTEGYELVVQTARDWGLRVQEHQDKMGAPGATLAEVRAVSR